VFDVAIFAQRHHGAGHEIRRPKIAAHSIEGDLHWWETLRIKVSDCKAKMETLVPSAYRFAATSRMAAASNYFPSSVNTCRPR
jgi:hypothetical protein